MSRKLLVSLPSRNDTSGSICASASMVAAFLPMRCVSIMSCAAVAFWRAEPPVCTLSAAISSASSWIAGLRSLMARTDLPRLSRFACSAITSFALRSFFFHCASSASSTGRAPEEVAGRLTPPAASPPFRSRLICASNSLRLSFSWVKASRLPCEACCAAFARRCDSMRILPTVAMYTVPKVAWRASSHTTAASTSSRPTRAAIRICRRRPVVNPRKGSFRVNAMIASAVSC